MPTTTHTTTILVRMDDVAEGLVAQVAASAIEPLAGPALHAVYPDGTDMVRMTFTYHACNDNEADRTAQVLRCAILPLVTGCTIAGTVPYTITRGSV